MPFNNWNVQALNVSSEKKKEKENLVYLIDRRRCYKSDAFIVCVSYHCRDQRAQKALTLSINNGGF